MSTASARVPAPVTQARLVRLGGVICRQVGFGGLTSLVGG
jgi:hypothetical protein